MKELKHKLLALLICIGIGTNAQNIAQLSPEKPYIEVTGMAEKKIVPDEIYISICLEDQIKKKRYLEEQEKDLKEAIKSLGIDLKQLSLSDANADYVRVTWRKKDVLNKAEYTLKVSDANQVGKVFKKLDEIEINGAFISKVDHSKMSEYKKEIRIEAIKAAKTKANYLLKAIDEKLGKPLIIRENTNHVYLNDHLSKSANYVANSQSKYDSGRSSYYRNEAVQFQKITLKSSIYIKFEVQ